MLRGYTRTMSYPVTTPSSVLPLLLSNKVRVPAGQAFRTLEKTPGAKTCFRQSLYLTQLPGCSGCLEGDSVLETSGIPIKT